MTTDTYPKVATRTADLGGVPVTINGIAKGAGMIAPDMATMLAFVVTDAPIAAPVLTPLLQKATADTFNAITVDGDTSTSDTLLLFATGKAPARRASPTPRTGGSRPFRAALTDLLRDLAHQVVRDGEGARKFVEVRVSGAASKKSARRIGMAIANSPLVKTAIAGEDANWGRIVMAVGKAGEPADRDRLAIWFGDTRVAVKGERDPKYSEAVASDYMKRAGDRDRGRRRRRQGERHGVDLRPHARLHRHQRRLPVVTRPVLVAAAAIVDVDGRVLIAQRPPGKSMAGLWEFPGGKVDPGEVPEAALARELKEELGIDVKPACFAPLTFASHATTTSTC